MRKQLLLVGVIVVLAGFFLTSVGCSSNKKTSTEATATSSSTAISQTTPAGTPSEVTATLTDFRIAPVPASVPAGNVTFNVNNIGATEHEMVIMKTDLASDALPTKADGSVKEDGPGVTAVDEAESMAAGEQRSLTVALAPGSYVLICNVVQTTNGKTVTHYQRGMAVAFTVTQ